MIEGFPKELTCELGLGEWLQRAFFRERSRKKGRGCRLVCVRKEKTRKGFVRGTGGRRGKAVGRATAGRFSLRSEV